MENKTKKSAFRKELLNPRDPIREEKTKNQKNKNKVMETIFSSLGHTLKGGPDHRSKKRARGGGSPQVHRKVQKREIGKKGKITEQKTSTRGLLKSQTSVSTRQQSETRNWKKRE